MTTRHPTPQRLIPPRAVVVPAEPLAPSRLSEPTRVASNAPHGIALHQSVDPG